MTHSNALEQQRLAKFAEIARDPSRLTEAQADGTACVFCGGEFGPMVVVGIINRVQVFGHTICPKVPYVAREQRAKRIVEACELLVKDHSITAYGRSLARQALEDARALIGEEVAEDVT